MTLAVATTIGALMDTTGAVYLIRGGKGEGSMAELRDDSD